MTGAAERKSAARPVALFVLGMGRSGTSAIARVLSLCGGELPTGVLGADAINPAGYWEPRAALHLNDKILHRNASAWYDPAMHLQDEGAFGAEEYARCVAEIGEFFTTLPAAPLVVIKEPRITLLSGMWFEAARLAGFDIAALVALRHPQEVVASIAAAIRTPAELASAVWLKYNLLAERETRGLPRVFVEYANLLDDWRREIARISAALAIDLSPPEAGAVEEFLKPDLRRQQYEGPVTEVLGTDWISTVYEALREAARDEPLDRSALEHVYGAYRLNEHKFRGVFEDFRGRDNSRFLGPSIQKLIRSVRAIAHRRSGTWA